MPAHDGPHEPDARRRRLPELVRAGGAGGVPARRRHAALVLVRLRRQDVPGRPGEGSRLRDGVLGHGAGSARQHAVGPPSGRTPTRRGRFSRTRGPCRSRPSASARGSNAVRAYFRNHASVPLAKRLSDYNDEMRKMAAHLPERHRSAGVLRLDASGVGVEGRPDLRQPARVRRHPREGVRGQPAASRRDALHHPRLRLRAAGHARHPGRAALRRHRAGRAARAPHAGAHLFDDRNVGGLDHLQPVGDRDPAGLLPCRRLHRLRVPAAGAGRQGCGVDCEGDDDAGAR